MFLILSSTRARIHSEGCINNFVVQTVAELVEFMVLKLIEGFWLNAFFGS